MRSRKSSGPEAGELPWAVPGLVVGVDEVGRGPLVGPVVVAAVMLDDERPIRGLRDSKALSPRRREALHDEIMAHALCVSIAEASAAEVDALNVLQATMMAMQRAVRGLRLPPSRVLVDGNRLPPLAVPAQAVVKGDARVACIAAASIVAKVRRDRWCQALDERWPDYGFAAHKGYPTPAHLQALRALGPCPEHRRSFAPVRQVLRDEP
ncbi:MAG TPA: ribonuclease HII [Rubrivivax sp.]|nr:ribonuclease HII [Burkholderiales bacterium]HNT40492.1 ribonuclease HII [Rubrivivax sp.]